MRPLAAIVLGLALVGGGAACGKGKKAKTTPSAGDKSGGQDAKGMGDGDTPDLEGSGAGAGSGSGSGSGSGEVALPGGGGGDDGGGGDGSGDGAGDGPAEAPPPIVPPNFDISPEQARSEVQRRLTAARTFLGARPPDSDGAIREARAALAADGTNIDAIVVIAHANYHKRLYDTAEVILDDLFKHRSSSQSNPYLYYVYGLVYDAIDEDQKAFVAFRRATELDASYPAALVNLGVHQLANKQYDDARRTYERLTGQLARNDAPTWNGLGSAYRGRAADYDPTSPERMTWLVKAEAAFKKAQTLDRNYGPAYYNLGLLYLDADPFPADGGGPLDTLVRLNKARTYFDEYKNLPGVDIKLYDERAKDVTKLIKREEKKRKKAASDAGG
jgi:tetratricopeptide (TPR) repeat protein